jgi:site-specific recombinase XerD
MRKAMNITEFNNKISDFLHHVRTEKNLSNHTCRAYAADLQQFSSFWQQQNPEASIKQALNHFKKYLLQQKTGTSTIARKFSCFNSYEKFIKQLGIKIELGLVRPHVPMPIPETLTMQEINFLLDEIPFEELPTQFPHRDKAILELLYATGIRCSEIISIRLADLDIQTKSIIIQAQRKQPRVVFFSQKAKEQLTAYIEQERMHNEEHNNAANPHEYLFLNYRHQPLTVRSIQRICNMFGTFLTEKNGSSKVITPQLLRHSFASHLLQQGTSPKTVQKLLGFTTSISVEKYIR